MHLYPNSGCEWTNIDCNINLQLICANSPQNMSGNHTLHIKEAFLANSKFHFWWNSEHQVADLGFNLTWHIENGAHLDVKHFFSKNLTGKISTPTFVSMAYREYSVDIELPNNITADNVLVFDIKVAPDSQQSNEMEFSTTEVRPEVAWNKMSWTEAEAYCNSKGGHLASAASMWQWNRLRDFIGTNLTGEEFWLGGTDNEKEGNWSWSDGSLWSEEHWNPHDNSGGSGEKCLNIVYGEWWGDPCENQYFFICSLPTVIQLKQDTQLVFTSENISLPALQFVWKSQSDGNETAKDSNYLTGVCGQNANRTKCQPDKMPT